jgi:GPH family glycoside/pentoside/hexuronide:cation symporter
MSEKPKISAKTFFGAEENSAASIDKDRLFKYSDIATKMFHTRVLSGKELVIPAVAEFASKVLRAVEVYQTLYFVNVLKINMVYVTAIYALIGIYDVLNDPLMGIVYDRTRTRWGKARPYILLGALPYYLSMAIMYSGALFLNNDNTNDPNKIIFVFVMLFIRETFSTIYNIPRGNILTLMTPNPKDRVTVSLLQTYVGEAGSQMVYALFLPLMELNNKGYINFPLPALFAVMACIASALGVIGNVTMAVNCKERVMLQQKPAPIEKSILYVLKNKYMLRNFIANFCVSWWANGGYSWDVVTQQEIFGGSIQSFIAYAPYNALDVLSVTFIPKFNKLFKNNNRNQLIGLRFWDIFCVIGMWSAIPFLGKDMKNRIITMLIFAVFHGLNAANNGPANVVEGEIGREISDYTEYVTGERPDGSIGILTNLITKITSPLNAMLTIVLFKWSGYDTTIKMLPWAQGDKRIYQKVWFLFNGIEVLPRVVRVIPYFFYDLVGEKREKMYIELNARRALMAKESEGLDENIDKMIDMMEKN